MDLIAVLCSPSARPLFSNFLVSELKRISPAHRRLIARSKVARDKFLTDVLAAFYVAVGLPLMPVRG